jgi:putative membrane protein insertion efficiency factor
VSGAGGPLRLSDPVVWSVRGYQRLISPMLPPVCRFTPSCSSYAIQAVQAHGLLRGAALAGARILRCNPFFPGGFDPVPPAPGASPPAADVGEPS